MKILIIGGSRGIGRETAKAALEAGHEVTIFARRPDRVGLTDPHLHLASGNVLDLAAVAAAVEGQDVVICTLGLPTRAAIGPPLAKRSYVLSAGTANIVAAMTAAGAKRLLCITAIGTGDSARQCTWFARLTLRSGLHWLFREKDRQEEIIRASSLDWTIVRPTALTNGRLQGAQVGTDLRSGLLTHVSRADVAGAMMAMLDNPSTQRKALVVSYPPQFGDSLRWVAGYFGKG